MAHNTIVKVPRVTVQIPPGVRTLEDNGRNEFIHTPRPYGNCKEQEGGGDNINNEQSQHSNQRGFTAICFNGSVVEISYPNRVIPSNL